MKLENKYIKCFSLDKSEELKKLGYEFLYEQHGVYYHKNNESITVKFSNSEVLKGIKFSTTINF